MSVTTTAVSSGPYTTNGATTSFPFYFRVIDGGEVSATLNGVAVDPSLYTATPATSGAAGGTLVFTIAPASGQELLISSDPDFTQDVLFENEGAFLPEVQNEVHDRSAIRDIWLKDGIDRSLKVPRGESVLALPSASERAGQLLGFNADGSPLLMAVVDVQNEIGSTLIDDGAWGGATFTSDGAWG